MNDVARVTLGVGLVVTCQDSGAVFFRCEGDQRVSIWSGPRTLGEDYACAMERILKDTLKDSVTKLLLVAANRQDKPPWTCGLTNIDGEVTHEVRVARLSEDEWRQLIRELHGTHGAVRIFRREALAYMVDDPIIAKDQYLALMGALRH